MVAFDYSTATTASLLFTKANQSDELRSFSSIVYIVDYSMEAWHVCVIVAQLIDVVMWLPSRWSGGLLPPSDRSVPSSTAAYPFQFCVHNTGMLKLGIHNTLITSLTISCTSLLRLSNVVTFKDIRRRKYFVIC